MSYETHSAKKHVVVSAVPDFFMRTPVGFAVAAPRNIRHDQEDRLLDGGELDSLLGRQITALQGNAHAFPDGLVHDVLHRDDLDENFALTLTSRLNYSSIPGVVNFVYYANGQPDEPSGKDPKIVFSVGIVTTRGYEPLGWHSGTTMLHRKGEPVLMLESEKGNRQKFISDQGRLKDLQTMVLQEFAESLSAANRPCFVPHNGDYHKVFLNPAHAYR